MYSAYAKATSVDRTAFQASVREKNGLSNASIVHESQKWRAANSGSAQTNRIVMAECRCVDDEVGVEVNKVVKSEKGDV
jgi:hypothetical protein